jgi:hypothetical protein
MPAQRVGSQSKDAAAAAGGLTARVPSADAPVAGGGATGAGGTDKDQD